MFLMLLFVILLAFLALPSLFLGFGSPVGVLLIFGLPLAVVIWITILQVRKHRQAIRRYLMTYFRAL